MKTYCICGESSEFMPVITYRNETGFREYEGLAIARCQSCGVLRTLAPVGRQIKPETSRVSFYEGNEPIFRKYFKLVADSVLRYCSAGTVLDVGCASGILLEIFKEKGFRVYGLEPNKASYRASNKKFPRRVFQMKLKDFLKWRKQRFEVIVYNHVLEHIQDIHQEFTYIKKALQPHGLLVVGLPNTDNIVFKLRSKYWESLLPNQHVWHFSTRYIQDFLKRQGFEILDTSFNNHLRQDYPLFKKLYFEILTSLNTLLHTGEAVLIIARRRG